ncbi:glucuronate isomerase [Marinoscillum furvescens]|nr:glucuronate isomerase [Marinoscillum furvescens]
MKEFLGEDFLLETETARKLYHDYASRMPIIDYHNHLPPRDIAEDRVFNSLTEAWLEGDHYKWRAMRANGVDESYITGDQSDKDKFVKWSETVPATLRNPLYHWTHLELRRYFGINELLSGKTGEQVFEKANAQISSKEFSCKNLLKKMNVEVVCTTDDPADSLEYHQQLKDEGFEVKVLPTFRPDKLYAVQDPASYKAYLKKLEKAVGFSIGNFDDLLRAAWQRVEFFHEVGGRLSDHGLEQLDDVEWTQKDLEAIFVNLLKGKVPSELEVKQYRLGMLTELCKMYHSKGWAQQFHLGAIRNNSERMMRQLGPDTGYDSIGDFDQVKALSKFLNKLDDTDQLAKTILYNLNPKDNEAFATMIGNFQDGKTPGKMQFGSGWWFLDQKDGMERQMNALSNMGLLSRFVGMLTDSRSFLSFPRHEYFRRILCNLIGNDVENGELPNDIEWLGSVVEDICYHNARNYFNF